MNPETVSILLVDDREENLTALEALLSDMGLHIVKALSGNDALRLALKHDFALVLMDVQMPEMDGFETAELLRANPKTSHLPIIFVTAGMKDMSYQFKGYDAGAVDYLLKPLEPTILRSKVRVFCDMHRQRCVLEQREASLEELVRHRTAELEQSAENLLRSEERYRNAFELAAVGIVHVNLDGTLVRVNASLCTTLGYAKDELEKLSMEEITHPDDRTLDREDVQLLLLGTIASYATEKRFLCKDGAIVWGHMAVALVRGENSEPSYYIVVIRDFTTRKQLEQQLRQAQKMEAIGQLAGGIAHDFNNLLSVIIGYANLAQMKIDPDDPLKQQLDQIATAAEKAAQLTSGLLAFSRKQDMKQKPVELNEMIESSAKLLKRLIGEDIQLETLFSDEKLFVNADSGQLDQVLMNMAANARDAMSGGGKFAIATGIQKIDRSFVEMHGFGKPGNYAFINISDTGTGMDQEACQKIFDPFFTTKEVGKGTGLGMSIAYGIITQHNGYIKVYSEPGIGTTFRIFLPLINVSEIKDVTLKQDLPKGGTETILLAEDDQAIRELEMNVLQDYGYDVLVASDGQEALEVFLANRHRIDLILLDMIMPRMNGSEAYKAIKNVTPDVKVLFISGYTADLIKDKGLLEKGGELIMKPISPPELARKVRELLDRIAVSPPPAATVEIPGYSGARMNS